MQPTFSDLSNSLKTIRFLRHGRAQPSEGRRRFRSPMPAIHVFLGLSEGKTWMPGTRPGMTNSRASPIPLAAFRSDSQHEIGAWSRTIGRKDFVRCEMDNTCSRG